MSNDPAASGHHDDDDLILPDLIASSGGLPDDGIGVPSQGSPEDQLEALLGSDGGLDLGSIMEQATRMQSQMMAAQQEAASTVVQGVAGGGAVTVSVTGGFDFQGVTIDPSAVDPADVEMLQDLVLAAVRHAVEQVNALQSQATDLGGLSLGDLFGN